jgi:hypothetical protein
MLGPKADCDRCGCVVPFYLRSLTDRNLVISDVVATIKAKLITMLSPGQS